MHGPINVKSSNDISKCQVGFNSAFKGLRDFSDLISRVANIGFSEEPYFKVQVVLEFSFATRSVFCAAVVGWLQESSRGRSRHYSRWTG
jgi:hypothetical protein